MKHTLEWQLPNGNFLVQTSSTRMRQQLLTIPNSKRRKNGVVLVRGDYQTFILLMPFIKKYKMVPSEHAMDRIKFYKDLLKSAPLKNRKRKIKKIDVKTINNLMTTEPLEHQIEALEVSTSFNGSGIISDPGTGKTYIGIASIGYRNYIKQVNRVMVCCWPKTVVQEWIDQLEEHAKFNYEVKTVSSKELWNNGIPFEDDDSKLQILLINYESLWRNNDEEKPYLARNVKKHPIFKWKPDMVIADESQRIGNKKSQVSKYMFHLGEIVPFKMILSATPIEDDPLAIFSQFKFVDNTIFGKSYSKFRDKYAKTGGFKGYQVLGYKNLKTLSKKVDSISYSVSIDDVVNIPKPLHHRIYIELSDRSRKAYNKIDKKLMLDINGKNIDVRYVLTKVNKLRQITGGFILDEDKIPHDMGREKITALKQFIKEFSKKEKIIIYVSYVHEIKLISDMLSKMKHSHVILKGGKKSVQDKAVKSFKDPKGPRFLISQIKVGSVGNNYQIAKHIMFYSYGHSLKDQIQGKGRNRRVDIDWAVIYHHLVGIDTVDEDLMESFKTKQHITKVIKSRLRKRK